MENYVTVMIEKNKLSSLQETINIGKHVLESKFAAYNKRSKKFEEANDMDTATFTMLFEKGELGDNKKWFEWDHVVNVVSLLKKKIDDLENLRYEY